MIWEWEAEEKSKELLRSFLTQAQRVNLDVFGIVDLKGPVTGNEYRLYLDEAQVTMYDPEGSYKDSLCILPKGRYLWTDADALLAKLLLILTDERAFLGTAFSMTEVPF